jgi:hypothetical protein
MPALWGMTEDVALYILLDGRRANRRAGVSQEAGRGVPVGIKRFGRVGDADDATQPVRALGRDVSSPLAVGVELAGKQRPAPWQVPPLIQEPFVDDGLVEGQTAGRYRGLEPLIL